RDFRRNLKQQYPGKTPSEIEDLAVRSMEKALGEHGKKYTDVRFRRSIDGIISEWTGLWQDKEFRAELEGVLDDNKSVALNFHQFVGINRVWKKMRLLLADLMGTGKTAQANTAFMGSEYKTGLFAVPGMAVSGWLKDFLKFMSAGAFENMDYVILGDPGNLDLEDVPEALRGKVGAAWNKRIKGYDSRTWGWRQGSGRILVLKDTREALKFLEDYNRNGKDAERRMIFVTNFTRLVMLGKTPGGLNLLKEMAPQFIAVDEAHELKNLYRGSSAPQRAKYLYELTQRAESVMFLSGTPLSNNPREVYSFIKLLFNGPEGRPNAFALSDSLVQVFTEFLDENEIRSIAGKVSSAELARRLEIGNAKISEGAVKLRTEIVNTALNSIEKELRSEQISPEFVMKYQMLHSAMMLRRKKEDVIQLPPVQEHLVSCDAKTGQIRIRNAKKTGLPSVIGLTGFKNGRQVDFGWQHALYGLVLKMKGLANEVSRYTFLDLASTAPTYLHRHPEIAKAMADGKIAIPPAAHSIKEEA
ncbi:MAG TPA: SNF2-related protein, partial [bacterium]|nr:SNF2-related protein [bacterium]